MLRMESRIFRFSKISSIFLSRGKISKDTLLCSSQKLLQQYGLIQPHAPGLFSLLPLGTRSISKLIDLIDDSMLSIIGTEKVSLPHLNDTSLWKTTGRLDMPELFRLRDRTERPYILAPTHEEVATNILAGFPLSKSDLPIRIYQITNKFRDELKPRNGLFRGREFLMKDLYTFDANVSEATKTYEAVCVAYERLFRTLGIGAIRAAGSTGVMGGLRSHEFLLPCAVGEDTLCRCERCGGAWNLELLVGDAGEEQKSAPSSASASLHCPRAECERAALTQSRALEVAHAFLLGTRYSRALGADLHSSNNKRTPLEMGCYGIGVTRLLAAAVEVSTPRAVDSGHEFLRWPLAIAPHLVALIVPKKGSKEEVSESFVNESYARLERALSSALVNAMVSGATSNTSDPRRLRHGDLVLDDRAELTIGRRVRDCRAIGIPFIVVIGKQTQAALTRGEEPLFEFISTYGLSDKPIGTSLSISEIALALQNEIRTRFL